MQTILFILLFTPLCFIVTFFLTLLTKRCCLASTPKLPSDRRGESDSPDTTYTYVYQCTDAIIAQTINWSSTWCGWLVSTNCCGLFFIFYLYFYQLLFLVFTQFWWTPVKIHKTPTALQIRSILTLRRYVRTGGQTELHLSMWKPLKTQQIRKFLVQQLSTQLAFNFHGRYATASSLRYLATLWN